MEGHVVAVLFLLVILALILLFYVLWRDYAIDKTRERLFEQRDALFDLALEGKISFEDPVYRELRRFLNNLIRGAHRFSFLWVLLHTKTAPSPRHHSARRHSVHDLIEAIPDPAGRERAKQIARTAADAVLMRMIATSVFACIGYATLSLLTHFGHEQASGWARSAKRRTLSEVEQDATAPA